MTKSKSQFRSHPRIVRALLRTHWFAGGVIAHAHRVFGVQVFRGGSRMLGFRQFVPGVQSHDHEPGAQRDV
jgi:hypothetical protein